jgi:tRNA(adenine34) deaminase
MNHYPFTSRDESIMSLALEEAQKALNAGNFPIGAILVVNDEIIAQAGNQLNTQHDRISHAEMLLFMHYSKKIYQWDTVDNAKVELYTTYEPCLMCLGTAILHRVQRIVVACQDPRGDMQSIQPAAIGSFYATYWPIIEYGLYANESFKLLHQFHTQRTDPEGKQVAELFSTLAKNKNIL